MTTENKFLVVEDKEMQAKIDMEIKKIKDIATKKGSISEDEIYIKLVGFELSASDVEKIVEELRKEIKIVTKEKEVIEDLDKIINQALFIFCLLNIQFSKTLYSKTYLFSR